MYSNLLQLLNIIKSEGGLAQGICGVKPTSYCRIREDYPLKNTIYCVYIVFYIKGIILIQRVDM